jgi:phage terminase small subunit
MSEDGKLAPKRRRFVEEYLIDLNATQAAIRAGYSKKTAGSKGEQLLKIVEIQNAVNAALAERSKRTEVTADRVVQELARIAFVDFRQIATWGPGGGVVLISSDELTDDEAAIVAEVSETTTETGGSLRIKRYDKIKALELLGKHLGMFVDRKEISGPNGESIAINQQKPDLSKLTDEELIAYDAICAKLDGETESNEG